MAFDMISTQKQAVADVERPRRDPSPVAGVHAQPTLTMLTGPAKANIRR